MCEGFLQEEVDVIFCVENLIGGHIEQLHHHLSHIVPIALHGGVEHSHVGSDLLGVFMGDVGAVENVKIIYRKISQLYVPKTEIFHLSLDQEKITT